MKRQKCCAHCPGKFIFPENNDFHECCQPRYVSGNLKISSLRKHSTDCPKRKEVAQVGKRGGKFVGNPSSCYEQFALAKKLHAENLEHHPLPDKLDDSIFKIAKRTGCPCENSKKKCRRCCGEDGDKVRSLNKKYGSALGCKEPETKMDLAICWETPVDPIYEPPRPGRIDGSEGGVAPAIFNLVEHSSTSKATIHSAAKREKFISVSPSSSSENSRTNVCSNVDKKDDANCHCECLCKELSEMKVSKESSEEDSRSKTFRKCVACQQRNYNYDPRLIKSTVGFALGMEKSDDNKSDCKLIIPRPKTPFAKRSFCIDTLTPPFSVINGQRDTDYPEHWRLMSVYQQSYRNPYRKRIYRC